MATKATRAVGHFDYVPKGDRALPAAEQSRFRFRPLTQAERMAAIDTAETIVEDVASGARRIQPRGWQQSRELVLATLVETVNFPAGEPVAYPADGRATAKSAYLEMLDDTLVLELGNYVFARSTLGDEEKNS